MLILLEYGSDFEAIDLGGRPPLYYAIKYRHTKIIYYLLFNCFCSP